MKNINIKIITAGMSLIVTAVVFGAPAGVWAEEERPFSVYCIGDSLTYGYIPFTGEKDVTYPDTLADLLGENYEVINLGKSGYTLTDAGPCYPECREYRESIEAAADMYIIMLGTNDAFRCVTLEEEAFEQELSLIVNAYREANPDTIIYLMAPPIIMDRTALDGEKNIPLERLEGVIHESVQDVSEEMGTGFIDLLQKTRENPDWIGEDGLHFTQEGYKEMGEFVFESIRESID